eukprot:1058632-Rhodomonas_salina.4
MDVRERRVGAGTGGRSRLRRTWCDPLRYCPMLLSYAVDPYYWPMLLTYAVGLCYLVCCPMLLAYDPHRY